MNSLKDPSNNNVWLISLLHLQSYPRFTYNFEGWDCMSPITKHILSQFHIYSVAKLNYKVQNFIQVILTTYSIFPSIQNLCWLNWFNWIKSIQITEEMLLLNGNNWYALTGIKARRTLQLIVFICTWLWGVIWKNKHLLFWSFSQFSLLG